MFGHSVPLSLPSGSASQNIEISKHHSDSTHLRLSRAHRSGLAAATPILSPGQKHVWNYVLFAAMGYRAYKSGKFMPAGMVALLAAGMIALRTF